MLDQHVTAKDPEAVKPRIVRVVGEPRRTGGRIDFDHIRNEDPRQIRAVRFGIRVQNESQLRRQRVLC